MRVSFDLFVRSYERKRIDLLNNIRKYIYPVVVMK